MAELSFSDELGPQNLRAEVIESLLAEGVINQSALGRAEAIARRTGQPVEQVLNQLGSLSDEDLVSAYTRVTGRPTWAPEDGPPQVSLETLGVSAEFLRRLRLLPLSLNGDVLTCASCDPLNEEALSGLNFATGLKVEVLVARPADWRRAFDAALGEVRHDAAASDERLIEREIDQVSDAGGQGAGARLVQDAFEAAIKVGASDIHFEPRRHDLRIRLRVDGRLVDHQIVSADLAAPSASRIKVVANLDIGERRLPQDGRTTFVVGGKSVDVRVATSPTVFGEAVVLRLLDRTAVPLDLDLLGFTSQVRGVIDKAGRAPHGLFLVTGPTGSGKTTTLYALLQSFAHSTKKVLSVEDPVEYHFEHVSQTQVAPNIGLTFAGALRSFLRQDPDVVLVGEIRDPETAAVAIQAAMTGHLVLASVHANDALGVVPRLMDMGVEPYQLAAGFRGAAAQRLVRKLCPHCRRVTGAREAERLFAASRGFPEPEMTFEPVGCEECRGAGFKGRLAISEAFWADDRILRTIAEYASRGLQHDSLPDMPGMDHDGYTKAVLGLTTIEEVMAVLDA